jgi:hypothetical protein
MLVSRRSRNQTVIGRLWNSLVVCQERYSEQDRRREKYAVRFSRWLASRENLEGGPTYVSIA